MQEEAILIGISQLAAVFSGFIAMFIAFVQAGEKLPPNDGFRARIIIFSSFAVVLASLLPLVIAQYGVSAALVWRIATAIYLAFGIVITVDLYRRLARMPDKGKSLPLVGRIATRIVTLAMFFLGIAILAGFGGGKVYITMLVCNLSLAAMSFTAFAVERF